MVGDSWEIDVMGAVNAGLRAVWFNRHATARPGLEDVTELRSFEPPEIAASKII